MNVARELRRLGNNSLRYRLCQTSLASDGPVRNVEGYKVVFRSFRATANTLESKVVPSVGV